jgi:hypothetical protein
MPWRGCGASAARRETVRHDGFEINMRGLLGLIGLIGAVFLFALLVDQITPLKQLDASLKAHPQPWMGLALGMAAVGLGLLLFVWISWGVLAGRPMGQDEAQQFMRSSAGQSWVGLGPLGKAAGGITTPEGVASFREVKAAFRSGAWLYNPAMRVFCVGVIGLLLLVLGGLGYFFVIGPPAVKVMCGGAAVYAFGRTAWEFWKA